MSDLSTEQGTAVISACRQYRYQLTRKLSDDNSRSVMWLMLNPSTADASINDATIRRCMEFSRRWGCGLMYVCNLYAFRSPHPEELWCTDDPIGPDNDRWIVNTLADVVVCAWGANARPDRVKHVLGLLGSPALCLGRTKDGAPKHPLARGKSFIPYDQPLTEYRA